MSTCRGDPEGWGPVSRLREFDLTLCFEESAIFTPLLALFVLSAAVSSIKRRARGLHQRSRKSVWALRAKLSLLSLAFVASCANLVLILATPISVVFLPQYVLEIASLLLALILTPLNHYRSRTSSALLLLFWPTYALVFAIWARTALAVSPEAFSLIIAVRGAVTALGFLSFLVECLGPEFTEEDTPGELVHGHVESPLLTANIFSIWSFGWMNTLMKKGATEYVTEKDLPALVPEDEAAALGDRLTNAMRKHCLTISLILSYGGPYGGALGMKLVQDALAFLQPQLLRWLLAYISTYQSSRFSSTDGPSPIEGFAIATIMFLASIVQTVILHQYFQRCFETGMRVRSGLITAIYKKALVLSNDGRSSASGDIVNLMSVDAARLQDFCTYGLIAISGPFQITLAFVSLYNIMGWPAFVGVAVMIVSIPLNTFIARILKKLQEKQMKNRDKRTRLMSELLGNIRSIKLYAWENAFMRWIFKVRNEEELKMLRKIGIYNSLNNALWTGIPLLVAFSSFAVAAYTSDSSLTADKIFPAISLYMLLQFPLVMFSMVTTNIIEAMVSIKRLSDFFAADELQLDVRQVVKAEVLEHGDVVVSVTNGEFSWNKNAVSPTLEDINFTVRKGELVGVLGRVGAGKTSLLSAIIGEMRRTEGEVKVLGSISYAPQNPWIMSATIKDNILFSHKYDEVFYNLVLDACALRPDLALMKDGDMTEVGEKGITLSGGQRARVALARAVYARADLIILDDVLAALDSHVAKHVFENVIGPNSLLASKARIVVTNSIHFLKHFDQIHYMRRGVILESGSYVDLVGNTSSEIYKLIKGHGTAATSGTSTPFITGTSNTPGSSEGENTIVDSTQDLDEKLENVSKALVRRKSYGRATLDDPRVAAAARPTSDGPSKEHTEQGRVKREVYVKYVEAASRAGFIAFVVASIAQQILALMGNNALRQWGNHNLEVGGNEGAGVYLLGYGLFSLTSTLLGGVGAILIWVLCSVRSAQRLHDSMLNAVMRAPLSFFELTPTGRILNLFSRDTYVVDMVLARVIQNTVRTLAVTAMIVVVIGYSFPLFLLAVPPLAWFYLRVMVYYLSTSRELKRLDAVSRSPIFAWFSESLNGLATIRAFGQQALFVGANEARVDRNQICYLPSIAVNRWLAVRLEFVGATIIFVTAMLSIVALVTTGVDAGLVGFVLSYALSTTGSLNWLVRSASEVEQNIVSVERILHYIELPPEADWEVTDAVPEEWPAKGEVEFRQYSTRYRPELDLVLKDLNIKIKPSEKIGIVGRTGSGKSTTLLSLFRILEPSSGTIYIDGVDITKVGLHDLRSAISIVPQNPDLFEGTIRDNIDPMGASSDADIWVALEQTHLKAFVESLDGGLDAPVREGGSSLSAGQRQLLCFARALLRKSRILVLDEATSAVDLDTDMAIQEIIRGPQFAHVTMLTIAHRVNTILESDRVLVLDAGKVIEFDSPKNLLAKKDSSFYSLAAEAGLA